MSRRWPFLASRLRIRTHTLPSGLREHPHRRLTCVLHESGAFTPIPRRPRGCPLTGSPPGTACLMSHVLVDASAAGVSSWLASPGPWLCLGKNRGGRSRGRAPPALALVRLSVSCVTLTSALPRARPPFVHLHHQGDLGLPEKASYFTDFQI